MVKMFVSLFAVIYFVVLLFSCSSSNNKPLFIGFSTDSSAVVLQNISAAGLLQLKNAPASDSVFYHLISVLQTPSEKDTLIKELPVPGEAKIVNDQLIFTPEMPFKKGRDYIVITFINSSFGDAAAIAKGELNYSLKPVQKTLTR